MASTRYTPSKKMPTLVIVLSFEYILICQELQSMAKSPKNVQLFNKKKFEPQSRLLKLFCYIDFHRFSLAMEFLDEPSKILHKKFCLAHVKNPI